MLQGVASFPSFKMMIDLIVAGKFMLNSCTNSELVELFSHLYDGKSIYKCLGLSMIMAIQRNLS